MSTDTVSAVKVQSAPCSPIYDPTAPGLRELPENIKAKHAKIKGRRQTRRVRVIRPPSRIVKKYPAVSAATEFVMEKRSAARHQLAVSAKVPEDMQPEFERAVKQVMQEASYSVHRNIAKAVNRVNYYIEKTRKAMTTLRRRRQERRDMLCKHSGDLNAKFGISLSTASHGDPKQPPHLTEVADCLECVVDSAVAPPPAETMSMDFVTLRPYADDEISDPSDDDYPFILRDDPADSNPLLKFDMELMDEPDTESEAEAEVAEEESATAADDTQSV